MDTETEGLLINLIEEAGEITQIASKCLRFGLNSYNPHDVEKTLNRKLLAYEIGNLEHIKNRLFKKGVIYEGDVETGKTTKEMRLTKYPLIIKEDMGKKL